MKQMVSSSRSYVSWTVSSTGRMISISDLVSRSSQHCIQNDATLRQVGEQCAVVKMSVAN